MKKWLHDFLNDPRPVGPVDLCLILFLVLAMFWPYLKDPAAMMEEVAMLPIPMGVSTH